MEIINRLKEKWMAPAAAVGGVLVILVGLSVMREPEIGSDDDIRAAAYETERPECVRHYLNYVYIPKVKSRVRVTQSVINDGVAWCERQDPDMTKKW